MTPAALVDIRHQLLRGLDENPSWAPVEAYLARVLRAEFDPDILAFRRIGPYTSPAILDNLIRYEAVHAIRDRRELLRRLQADRRCFGLFHASMPDEPVAFTEIAFTRSLTAQVQPLLDPESPVIDPASCDCAMFYSISSCHEGLRGVPFGNALIRRAVDALGREAPQLTTFATVSPVPGFRAWLTDAASQGGRSRADLAARLKDPSWLRDPAKSKELEATLLPLCAFYLLHVKRGTDPIDPVARFHLGNGARLERINWLGDASMAGLERSGGLTANYVYSLPEIDRNQDAYRTKRTVTASRWIERLANA
jgi:malonyl-CoA decarboxylase